MDQVVLGRRLAPALLLALGLTACGAPEPAERLLVGWVATVLPSVEAVSGTLTVADGCVVLSGDPDRVILWPLGSTLIDDGLTVQLANGRLELGARLTDSTGWLAGSEQVRDIYAGLHTDQQAIWSAPGCLDVLEDAVVLEEIEGLPRAE